MRWLAHGEPDLPDDRDWLSAGEMARLATFRFTKPHREYLVRRWTSKHAVAAALGLGTNPEQLRRVEIRNRPSGAPFVMVDGEAAAVDVSLTDRAGWAVCLVSPPGSFEAGTLGVDLEIVEERSPEFVADFLTATEAGIVRAAATDDDRHALANLHWSAKEAALKVLQLGLRVDTHQVHVALDGRAADASGWGRLQVTALDQQFPGYWRRDGQFVLTVCFAESHLPDTPPVMLPGGSDLAAAEPLHTWQTEPLVRR